MTNEQPNQAELYRQAKERKQQEGENKGFWSGLKKAFSSIGKQEEALSYDEAFEVFAKEQKRRKEEPKTQADFLRDAMDRKYNKNQDYGEKQSFASQVSEEDKSKTVVANKKPLLERIKEEKGRESLNKGSELSP